MNINFCSDKYVNRVRRGSYAPRASCALEYRKKKVQVRTPRNGSQTKVATPQTKSNTQQFKICRLNNYSGVSNLNCSRINLGRNELGSIIEESLPRNS